MLDHKKDFVLLAYRDRIIYVDIEKCNIDGTATSDMKPTQKTANTKTFELADSDIQFLKLDSCFKIVCIQEIGNDLSCVVLENR